MHRSQTTRLAALLQSIALAGVTLCSSAADIQLGQLRDINFGAVPPTVGDLRGESPFCVSMQPRARYSLIGEGSGPQGSFRLTDAGNKAKTVEYRITVTDRGRRRGRTLRPGQPLSNLRASRVRPNNRCQPAGLIRVTVPAASIAAASPGRYAGTLSLTVVPE